MEKITDVAQYFFDEYRNMSGEVIDEMKLHKLLYFTQRESIAITGQPMFLDKFEGWKYGPVNREVRSCYTTDGLCCQSYQEISPENAYIAKSVLLQYGEYASWKLSKLSHDEISWKNAREGIPEGENGCRELNIEDIRKDAEKIRPFDPIWDMYYDEFEDFDTEAGI